jgi:hypothetical protein
MTISKVVMQIVAVMLLKNRVQIDTLLFRFNVHSFYFF